MGRDVGFSKAMGLEWGGFVIVKTCIISCTAGLAPFTVRVVYTLSGITHGPGSFGDRIRRTNLPITLQVKATGLLLNYQ